MMKIADILKELEGMAYSWKSYCHDYCYCPNNCNCYDIDEAKISTYDTCASEIKDLIERINGGRT